MKKSNYRLICALLDKLEEELSKISSDAGYLTYSEFIKNNYINIKKENIKSKIH